MDYKEYIKELKELVKYADMAYNFNLNDEHEAADNALSHILHKMNYIDYRDRLAIIRSGLKAQERIHKI